MSDDRDDAKVTTMDESTDQQGPAPPVLGPITVAIDGAEYPLGRLDFSDVMELCVKAKQRAKPLIALLKPHLDGMPVAAQKAAIEAAVLTLGNPVLPGTPEFAEYLYSAEGLREVLSLSLRAGGATLPREATDRAAASMDLTTGQRVIARAVFGG